MKHFKYIGLAALALAFTACDDIEDSNSLPQTNPQLPGVSADNVSVAAGADAASAIDLTTFNNANKLIAVAKIDTPTDWPEGFTANVPFMQVSAADDFSNPFEVETETGAEGEVLVSPDTWNGAWKEALGKNPEQRKLHVRFPVFAVNGTQEVRMGGKDKWYGNSTVTVTPFNPFDHVIEESYYIVGSFCNWDLSQALKMNHSSADQYDDPVFRATVTVDGAGYQWVVVPASTVAAGNIDAGGYGGEYDGITATDGFLVASAAGQRPGALVIDQPGKYVITVNMENLSFSAKFMPTLYTPGNSNGWNAGASQTLISDNGIEFTGFAHLNGEFKFADTTDWSGLNYGNSGTEGVLTTDGSAGNLNAPADALYWAKVDIAELTYTLTEISAVGLVGDATPGGWDNDTHLTPSADFLTWTATVTLKDGQFKFRFNNGWDINLGGSLDDLTSGGDNLPVSAGNYLVTLNLSSRPYSATLTKQ